MTHHRIPNPPLAAHLTTLKSQPSAAETGPTVLHLDQRRQFVQRLALLIRRIQAQPHVRDQEDQPDES